MSQGSWGEEKRKRYPAGACAVEREEDAMIMTASINSDEDHESDHKIILHHGKSYDNDF